MKNESGPVLRAHFRAARLRPPTTNVMLFEMPPPGSGVKLVICARPGVARSAAGTVTRSSSLLTKVVGRSDPFQRTTLQGEKEAPWRATVTPLVPGNAAGGTSESMCETGLLPLLVRVNETGSVGRSTDVSGVAVTA